MRKGCTGGDTRRHYSANGIRDIPFILRKEVIQPQVPLRLPCYDFAPVADLTVDGYLPDPKIQS